LDKLGWRRWSKNARSPATHSHYRRFFVATSSDEKGRRKELCRRQEDHATSGRRRPRDAVGKIEDVLLKQGREERGYKRDLTIFGPRSVPQPLEEKI